MGSEIPIVLGGFGPNAKCVSDKTVAELHGMEPKNVRARITDNIARFSEGIDFLDVKKVAYQTSDLTICSQLGYNRMEISKAEHIYLLSERGYAKLVKIMDTDQAWDIYNHMLDEYFTMREETSYSQDTTSLSPDLRFAKAMWDTMVRTELEQKRQAAELKAVNRRVDKTNEAVKGISDVVSLHPQSWREEYRRLLVKVAKARGGDYSGVNAECFALVDKRAGVSLKTRLTNKRRRMASQGVCESQQHKLTKVDVISDDKKLVEIYIAVVKEMAVKYGIASSFA